MAERNYQKIMGEGNLGRSENATEQRLFEKVQLSRRFAGP